MTTQSTTADNSAAKDGAANSAGVCYPAGFKSSGIVAGLKASGRRDLALVVNEGENVSSAVVTTTNRVFAAPVKHLRQQPGRHRLTHVILNSGNANAATGEAGYQDVLTTAHALAQNTGANLDQVAVCSTGVIGQKLDVDTLVDAIPELASKLQDSSGVEAAEAICTTDTRIKIHQQQYFGRSGETEGQWRVGGMVKGAGMIAPAMATMLAIVTTDAAVSPAQAQRSLEKAVARTFNRTDTDGCMSTNDTVILMCSGRSAITPSAADFDAAVEAACADLAGQILEDAEGAHHSVSIEVRGAHSEAAAEIVGRAVVRSALFKTAIYGGDPNWGRILSQVGTVPTSEATFEADQIEIAINGTTLCRGGAMITPTPEVELPGPLAPGHSGELPHVHVLVNLNAGPHHATIYTTDLTNDYVAINSEYTT
ncbi:MAG: bifunctional glutamate N-acetyltransferase/amino-acid acetyltransferase ArgJ [Actinomycetaceae bacterium]|nr:bifunctional glutamate N-acetyltransferase/amino-acid acetyltransferase ArgJ [Actinomycetaceae bacterium]